MFGYTVEELYKKLKFALVLACVGTIIMVITNISSGEIEVTVVGDLVRLILLIIVSPILMTIGVFGFILNYKKIFSGFIRPIPIISAIPPYLMGLVMAIRAFIYIMKNHIINKNAG